MYNNKLAHAKKLQNQYYKDNNYYYVVDVIFICGNSIYYIVTRTKTSIDLQ